MSDDTKIYFPIMDIFKRGTGNTLLLLEPEEIENITAWIKSGCVNYSYCSKVKAPGFFKGMLGMGTKFAGFNLDIGFNNTPYEYPYLDIGTISIPNFIKFLNSMQPNICLVAYHSLSANGIKLPENFILAEDNDHTIIHNARMRNLIKTTITL
jgi:hypothetical protein